MLCLDGSISCVAGVRCVQITDLRVPSLVRNGSASHALLDCEYSLSQEESGPNSGLVVKWFFNDSPSPVYQWIPGKHPQDLDILKGRLNLDYKASNHKSTMHRALYINNPTTELSGNYKCVVSTFDDEDFMNKKMTVFASPSRFEILQSRHDADTINITCVASGVFPEPKVFLWKHPDAVLMHFPLLPVLQTQLVGFLLWFQLLDLPLIHINQISPRKSPNEELDYAC
ncbi:hypothetical protein M8J76_005281 [Diaphorina citri]|nr:hypothetical protein M8J76_005281 [Diaphorina citri]